MFQQPRADRCCQPVRADRQALGVRRDPAGRRHPARPRRAGGSGGSGDTLRVEVQRDRAPAALASRLQDPQHVCALRNAAVDHRGLRFQPSCRRKRTATERKEQRHRRDHVRIAQRAHNPSHTKPPNSVGIVVGATLSDDAATRPRRLAECPRHITPGESGGTTRQRLRARCCWAAAAATASAAPTRQTAEARSS